MTPKLTLAALAVALIGCTQKPDAVKQLEQEDAWTAAVQASESQTLKNQAALNDQAAKWDAICQAKTMKVNGSDVKLKVTREANGRVQCDLPADVKAARDAEASAPRH